MPKPAPLRFDDITLKQEAQFTVVISEELVATFAKLSGDTNPLHMDEGYASETPFKGRVVHGMLCASFFSNLVGMHLPGRYAVYLSQTLFFKKPCRIDMRLVVRGRVIQKTHFSKTLTIKTEILDEITGECLVDGEAMVQLLA
jgi:acyl dehydratase